MASIANNNSITIKLLSVAIGATSLVYTGMKNATAPVMRATARAVTVRTDTTPLALAPGFSPGPTAQYAYHIPQFYSTALPSYRRGRLERTVVTPDREALFFRLIVFTALARASVWILQVISPLPVALTAILVTTQASPRSWDELDSQYAYPKGVSMMTDEHDVPIEDLDSVSKNVKAVVIEAAPKLVDEAIHKSGRDSARVVVAVTKRTKVTISSSPIRPPAKTTEEKIRGLKLSPRAEAKAFADHVTGKIGRTIADDLMQVDKTYNIRQLCPEQQISLIGTLTDNRIGYKEQNDLEVAFLALKNGDFSARRVDEWYRAIIRRLERVIAVLDPGEEALRLLSSAQKENIIRLLHQLADEGNKLTDRLQ